MNDIKVFITVEITSEDIPDDHKEKSLPPMQNILETTYSLINENILTQLKITNLPPRKSGFIKASELKNIEGGD